MRNMRKKEKHILPNHFLFLINKAPGITSHDEVAKIRSGLRKLGLDVKVGHSGTLDPKVTGLLVIGVGKATKLLSMVLESPKTYVGTLEIHKPVESEMLEDATTRSVYSLDLLNFSKREAQIKCVVERGTYIRKLFHDMGEYMKTGASMGELHRTGVAHFTINDARVIASDDLVDLIDAYASAHFFNRRKLFREIKGHCIPSQEILKAYKKVMLEKNITKYLGSGSDLFVPGIFSVESNIEIGDDVAVFDGVTLVALGVANMDSEDIRLSEKGVAVKIKTRLIS